MWNRLLGSLDPMSANRVRLFKKSLETPMLRWTGVRILEDSPQKSEFLVPLTWRTRNSWGTVFFAAIATGIDITGGWAAFQIAEANGVRAMCMAVLARGLHTCIRLALTSRLLASLSTPLTGWHPVQRREDLVPA